MLEKARGSLANALARCIAGAAVLDLYAGSGALGIEMLSRGAELAVFVERDPAAVKALSDNLARCGLLGRSLILPRSAGSAVGRLAQARLRRKKDGTDETGETRPALFDLVFVDPPFEQAARWASDPEGRHVTSALPSLLRPGGVVLFRFEERRAAPPDWPGLAPQRDQRYGRSRVVWYVASDEAGEPAP